MDVLHRRRDPAGAWFAFTEDPMIVAGTTRIAFPASSRDDVDRVAATLTSIGALEIDGPSEAKATPIVEAAMKLVQQLPVAAQTPSTPGKMAKTIDS